MSAFDELDQRFTSGNDVNVGSIHLSRELYERLSAENKHNNVAMSQMSKAQLQNYNMATKSWDEATRLRQQLEIAVWAMSTAVEALQYAAYNIDGSKIENLSTGVVESTGASESALIAARDIMQALAQIRELEK